MKSIAMCNWLTAILLIPFLKVVVSSPNETVSENTTTEIARGKLENIQTVSIGGYEEKLTVGAEILRNASKICGAFLGKRISFGEPTTLMEYPWTVLLIYDTPKKFHCGGSLISDRYVLTAAHCATKYVFPLVGVRIGEHNITSEKDCAEDIVGELICSQDPIDAKISRIIIHQHYNRFTLINDIALLRLEETIEFSRSYYPICLPHYKEEFTSYSSAIISGWGVTEKRRMSDILLRADVPILSIKDCIKIYRTRSFQNDTEICASGVHAVHTCSGDSGGPMFIRLLRNSRERYLQLGIISLSAPGCGDERTLPGVFTRVSAYMHWIENNLQY